MTSVCWVMASEVEQLETLEGLIMLSRWASITHFLDMHRTLLGQRETVLNNDELKALAKTGLHD